MLLHILLLLCAALATSPLAAQTPPLLLRRTRVFDGVEARPHEGWVVRVRGKLVRSPR